MSYSTESEKKLEKANCLATLALGLINQVEQKEGSLKPGLRRAQNCLDTASRQLGNHTGNNLNPGQIDDVDDCKENPKTLEEYLDQKGSGNPP